MDWYAIVVPAQKELAVRSMLAKAGLEVIVPVEMKWKRKGRHVRRAGRMVECEYPLMPRYVFVGFERQPDWWYLRNLEFADGRKVVQSVLGTNGMPKPLTREAVDALKGLQFAIPTFNPHKGVRVGDTAQFIYGPMRGQIAKVRKIVAKRARVLVELFNSWKEITVPLELLEAA